MRHEGTADVQRPAARCHVRFIKRGITRFHHKRGAGGGRQRENKEESRKGRKKEKKGGKKMDVGRKVVIK
jgi:hypothetical protein